MGSLNKNVKKEPANALDDLAKEIEAYPELKESLQRFLDNPNMERYTAKELKELRYGERR